MQKIFIDGIELKEVACFGTSKGYDDGAFGRYEYQAFRPVTEDEDEYFKILDKLRIIVFGKDEMEQILGKATDLGETILQSGAEYLHWTTIEYCLGLLIVRREYRLNV